jgi:hypothetical protein
MRRKLDPRAAGLLLFGAEGSHDAIVIMLKGGNDLKPIIRMMTSTQPSQATRD